MALNGTPNHPAPSQCHGTKDVEVPISFHGAASPIEVTRSS
ncbi:hypothetical protein PIIN_05322 [Serendipita indica DSM 11827]|uniref:Uncharacterized protein n=1 Tax=Serendipita indica (strain DSM 11827) TaxID=1109443 RepID=G4TJ90_SERID|nr:hypothetical protein PIIN_05322 [Serendipita indica DSM 11827]